MRSNTNPSTCQPIAPPNQRRAVAVTLLSAKLTTDDFSVNHHELMQRHQCHIRCECIGTHTVQKHSDMPMCGRSCVGLPTTHCSHSGRTPPTAHSAPHLHLKPCAAHCLILCTRRSAITHRSHHMAIAVKSTPPSLSRHENHLEE